MKLVAGMTWTLSGLSAAVSTRYFGSYNECGNTDGVIGFGDLCSLDDTFRRRVHAYNSWDVSVRYSSKNPFGITTVAIGANNVFDTRPPTIYNSFWPTSDATTYDFTGRFVYAQLKHRM
jgi:outer membrane receptor protein involved in Fe transport